VPFVTIDGDAGHCNTIAAWRTFDLIKHLSRGGGTMITDDRDVLDVLKFELDFIEKGGYGRSVRTPWLPRSIFQDSLTCLNFGDPNRSHPCDECLLMALVPPERCSEKVPCHHIPLTPEGETIHHLERSKAREVMEEIVKNWLRRMIKILEDARAEQAKP
jgi:hypothetical protein